MGNDFDLPIDAAPGSVDDNTQYLENGAGRLPSPALDGSDRASQGSVPISLHPGSPAPTHRRSLFRR